MNQKIKDIIQKHRKQLSVSCDEYHFHSLEKGCIIGPIESIEIFTLARYIYELEEKIQAAADAMK